MNYLNAQQLAFILDIKKEDARARMCNAWEKEKGIEKSGYFGEYIRGAKRNKKNKIEDPYPLAMPIEILSKHLNIPELQFMVDDIERNYLARPATKKYILFDYPEKFCKKRDEEGKQRPHHIHLPPALDSLLPTDIKHQIFEIWKQRFPVFTR
jgi:hypothetical protein